MVPLSVVTKQEISVSPLTINHQDQFPSVTLSFNLGHSLGDAITAIQDAERQLEKPATLTSRFSGVGPSVRDVACHSAILDRGGLHCGLHRAWPAVVNVPCPHGAQIRLFAHRKLHDRLRRRSGTVVTLSEYL
jgi:hypothetical protein